MRRVHSLLFLLWVLGEVARSGVMSANANSNSTLSCLNPICFDSVEVRKRHSPLQELGLGVLSPPGGSCPSLESPPKFPDQGIPLNQLLDSVSFFCANTMANEMKVHFSAWEEVDRLVFSDQIQAPEIRLNTDPNLYPRFENTSRR